MKSQYYQRIGELRKKYQKSINNLFIWSSINIAALKEAKNNKAFLNQQHYPITSRRRDKQVDRSEHDVLQLINNALDYEYYYSIFAYAVAQCEGFIFDVIKETLLNDNRKLKISINGINFCKNVEVNDVIDASNKDEIINNIIEKNLTSIFYAAPKYQLEYLKKITSVKNIDEIFDFWVEIKATRDIIIHNQGIVNETYLIKSGNKARESLNKQIIIDENYFNQSLANIKSLIGKIASDIQRDGKI